MNPIGVNAWVWVSPPTNESIAELAPRVKAMGFDLFELGLENPGDWDPQRMADVFAANELSAAVCAAMGPGRDLTDPDTVDATREYLRACIDAVAALGGTVVAGPMYTPVGKTWQMDAAERATTLDRLIEGLRPLVDYAGERGVRLGIEPLNRFETSVLNTAATIGVLRVAITSPGTPSPPRCARRATTGRSSSSRSRPTTRPSPAPLLSGGPWPRRRTRWRKMAWRSCARPLPERAKEAANGPPATGMWQQAEQITNRFTPRP